MERKSRWEKGEDEACVSKTMKRTQKQLVSCGNLWNLRAQKSQRSSAALTIYTKCAQHALNFSQYSFCMHLTPKHSANFFITQRHRNISHTHTPLFCRTVLAVLAASFQALTAQRPVFFVAALWPRAVELPIGEGTWKKKENGYSLASIRFQLSAAIHTKRFFVNKTLDQRINAEYLDTSWASGE